MFNEVLACLDGSPLAETILPLSQGLAAAAAARLTLLRVVADKDDITTEQNELRDCARRYRAELKLLMGADPAQAIADELESRPGAVPAMTTHGRSAWAEALIGSVALNVIQKCRRPVIIYRSQATDQQSPRTITTIAVALDGGGFSERIIPAAAELAKAIHAKLMLLQALPAGFSNSKVPNVPAGDILESSYLRAKAAEIEKDYGIESNWDVLHGEPGDAISQYIAGISQTLLAMTSHARSGLQKAFLGSVAAECIRKSGAPMLIYWPHP
jgi:nucleotide-binding universal stress UspA family protein